MLVREELPEMYKITTILQEYDLLYRDLEEENRQLHQRIDKAIETINYYATEDEDYSKIYNGEEKELLEILKGEE